MYSEAAWQPLFRGCSCGSAAVLNGQEHGGVWVSVRSPSSSTTKAPGWPGSGCAGWEAASPESGRCPRASPLVCSTLSLPATSHHAAAVLTWRAPAVLGERLLLGAGSRAPLCPALLLPNPCLEAAPFAELGLQPATGNVYTAAVTEKPFTFCRASRCLRVAGFCVACVGSTFPSGGVYPGLGEEPGTAAGEAGRGEGCSSAPSCGKVGKVRYPLLMHAVTYPILGNEAALS